MQAKRSRPQITYYYLYNLNPYVNFCHRENSARWHGKRKAAGADLGAGLS
jgi:hypothetical protein